MWFTILLSPPSSSSNKDDDAGTSPLSLLVGSDGHIYLRATDVFKLVNLRRDPWKMCRRFAPTAGRTAQTVLRRGIPTPYPHMKIFTFAEAVNILKKVPGGGVAVADYLVRVFIQDEARVKLTERKHQYARRELYYCSNPTRAAVYRIVSNDDDDETIRMTKLMETARTKFLEFYRRLQPTKPQYFVRQNNDPEEEENDNSLVIVTDEEELQCMSQKQQQQQQKQQEQKPKPTTNDVIQIHFPTVPKEIVWSDGKATYTFRCVKFYNNNDQTLYRAETNE